METAARSAEELKLQIKRLENELAVLKSQLAELESREAAPPTSAPDGEEVPWKWPLQADEYDRYGRQLILPSIGIQGQLNLKQSAVLIVGAGGLGCPAAAYLAGAGVGTLGVVDSDVVEASNLHRQIAHSTAHVGMSKVDSLIAYARGLNPLPTYRAHNTHLTPNNAASIVSRYDLVLDCTDHPTSRYLVSDACVLLGKPLVSASALRTDGQLIVLNCPPTAQGVVAAPPADGGPPPPPGPPCYRCVFPRPPPPDAVTSCGEGGILGPVVGVMGVLQALEAIRIIAAGRHRPADAEGGSGQHQQQQQPTLLLLSAGGQSPATFRSVRMRGRRKDCFACGEGSTLTLETLASGSLDYVAFCGGAAAPVDVLADGERVGPREYQARTQDGKRHLLLDVREKEHFDIASISGAINVPFSKMQSYGGGGQEKQTEVPRPEWIPGDLPDDAPIYVVCRVGNDSQLVTKQLKEMGLDRNGKRFVGDIRGGMRAWKRDVDNTLPFM
ncbi:uncharacterized protein E0L32_003799 [Thyridium curvatum]|uniref:Adenylyltransferase and sulfurtransferase uba4 n=1 Tax=Thyridium curvatum TaxID=1093900 RepID=A0A507B087_9PEZI|nr:uncharacterized protein E0L32_003799 [Thyridium curvatum]TPX16505.1 hypothetical protein E0L32_003799 [Thyridium curvatum]